MTARGACLCGAVRYAVEGPLRPAIACHCAQCRKTSGHHVVATSALRAHVRIEGADALRWFRSSPAARRGFCGTCGSQLFWEPTEGPRLSIFAGSLDAAEGLALAGRIFCASKGPYYEIADGAPQAPGADPRLTTA